MTNSMIPICSLTCHEPLTPTWEAPDDTLCLGFSLSPMSPRAMS